MPSYLCGSRWIVLSDQDGRLLIRPRWCGRIGCPRCGPVRDAQVISKAGMVFPEMLWMGAQQGTRKRFKAQAGRIKADYLAVSAGPGEPRQVFASHNLGLLHLVTHAAALNHLTNIIPDNKTSWSDRWNISLPSTGLEFVTTGTRQQVERALQAIESQGGIERVGDWCWPKAGWEDTLAGLVRLNINENGHLGPNGGIPYYIPPFGPKWPNG